MSLKISVVYDQYNYKRRHKGYAGADLGLVRRGGPRWSPNSLNVYVYVTQ